MGGSDLGLPGQDFAPISTLLQLHLIKVFRPSSPHKCSSRCIHSSHCLSGVLQFEAHDAFCTLQAKQARQLGAFDDPEEAARAYSTCAMQLQGQLTSLPEVSEQEPLTAALVSSCLSAQVPLKR